MTLKHSLFRAVGLILLTSSVIGATACHRSQAVQEPIARDIDEIEQTAVAADAGIEIVTLGAAFSGTETLLRLRVTVVDTKDLAAAAGTDATDMIGVANDGFAGPFAPGQLENMIVDDTLIITLPPVELEPDTYDGGITLAITALSLRSPQGETRVPGSWALQLQGPDPSELGQALRIEHLGPETMNVDGYELVVRGKRSTSSTEVEFSLPKPLRSITQPLLIVDGQRYAPFRVATNENTVVALFPATDFGHAIGFDPGTFTRDDDVDALTFIVNLGGALGRHQGGDQRFAIDEGDVVFGPADRIVAGEYGIYHSGDRGDRQWVGIVIEGNWTGPYDATVFDAEGEELQLAHLQTQFNTDVEGNVVEGTTNVAVFVDNPGDAGELTIVMGPRAQLIRDLPTVTLQPR